MRLRKSQVEEPISASQYGFLPLEFHPLGEDWAAGDNRVILAIFSRSIDAKRLELFNKPLIENPP